VKKEQNGRKSLRRLKPTVGCNASKRRRRRRKLLANSADQISVCIKTKKLLSLSTYSGRYTQGNLGFHTRK
jgi:hypothetical protein